MIKPLLYIQACAVFVCFLQNFHLDFSHFKQEQEHKLDVVQVA